MRHTYLLAFLLAACTPVQAGLEPATSADEVRFLERAARAQDGDIIVVAQAAAWPGEAIITQKVTPIRLRVENHGDVEASIHLENIALLGGTGRVYAAVPPVLLSGAVDRIEPPTHPFEPGFDSDRFVVARRYRTAYPGLSAYNGRFDYNLFYNRTRYEYWEVHEILPTPEMVQHALPEGVLEAGGHVTGWVYFEKVDAMVEREVALSADVLPVEGDEPLAQLDVPFVTE